MKLIITRRVRRVAHEHDSSGSGYRVLTSGMCANSGTIKAEQDGDCRIDIERFRILSTQYLSTRGSEGIRLLPFIFCSENMKILLRTEGYISYLNQLLRVVTLRLDTFTAPPTSLLRILALCGEGIRVFVPPSCDRQVNDNEWAEELRQSSRA